MCLTRLWYDKNMEANEYTEFEGRRYVNPTISRDEQMAFIDNLRNTQTANNEQIQTDTYNLGTHIPMTQGGLATGATDPDSYFMQRYQTPQVDSQVATLKATAQAQALNDVLSNYQKQMKKRYNDAYRAYNKRKNTPATTPTTTDPLSPEDDDVITKTTEDEFGNKVGMDELSNRIFNHKTKFDINNELEEKRKEYFPLSSDISGVPYWLRPVVAERIHDAQEKTGYIVAEGYDPLKGE